MNRIGAGGRGESVWLGFFLYRILELMIPVCQAHGEGLRAARYAEYRSQLGQALNREGWDGDWYRRAYFDDGTPLGSRQNDECQIDALVQAWSVLSHAAPPERAEKAIRAVEVRLVDQAAGLIRLLAPSFDQTKHDPGYIKGYLPGIRENGGQYTHGVLWFIRALAQMGRGTAAVQLLEMLCPINHARTLDEVAVYQTEPYVVAADVYGEPPHVGRGGWTWYTGSAGWMFRVTVESILGLGLESGRTLVIDPRIPTSWPSCRFRYRLPDGQTHYEVVIENPAGKEWGVTSATVDGELAHVEQGVARITMIRDGKSHLVVVRL